MNFRLTVLFLLLLPFAAHTQLRIWNNGKTINYQQAGITYALQYSGNFSDSAFYALSGKWQSLTDKQLSISHQPYTVWLRIPLQTIKAAGDFNYVNIENPHINRLQCWIVQQDSIIRKFNLTGDNILFNSRPIPLRHFSFPVADSLTSHCDIIIATDKRYTKLDLPVHFISASHYLATTQHNNLFLGIFLGMAVLLLIFNSYLFIIIREQLYLWYSLYLSFILLYLCTDKGLLFQYIYPQYPQVNDIIRPAFFAFSIVPLMLFFNSLLNIKQTMPKLYRFNIRLWLGYIVLFFLAVSTSSFSGHQVQIFWLYANRIITPLVLIIIFIQAFYCWYKGVRLAAFAALSFLNLSLFFSIYSLQQNGIITDNSFTRVAHYWGLVFESFVMAFSLAWRYKLYKEDAERLQLESRKQQEQLFIEIASWQEKEMQRLSSLLHDHIGGSLGLLRLKMDNMSLSDKGKEDVTNYIIEVANDVRFMSHHFSPMLLQSKGLFKSLTDIVQLVNQNSNIHLQFEWVGQQQKLNYQYELIVYRIVQELIQNMVKHSKASQGFLQIITEYPLISIYAEDNGAGVSEISMNNGIGLASIEKMVTILDGHYTVKSAPGEGFVISVEFNQYAYEHN